MVFLVWKWMILVNDFSLEIMAMLSEVEKKKMHSKMFPWRLEMYY